MKRLVWLVLLVSFAVSADPFYNAPTTETGCDPANPGAGVLICDDVEDVGRPANMQGFACSATWGDPCNDGLRPLAQYADGPWQGRADNYRVCNSADGVPGAAGTNCYGDHSPFRPHSDPQNQTAASVWGYRDFPGSGYQHIQCRYYAYFDNRDGFTPDFLKQYIMESSLPFPNNQAIAINFSRFSELPPQFPALEFQTDTWRLQNQGNNIVMNYGRWHHIMFELHIRSPSGSNDLYRLWVDDCGADGLGCDPSTDSPTLRSEYTNLNLGPLTFETTYWYYDYYCNEGCETGVRALYTDQLMCVDRSVHPGLTFTELNGGPAPTGDVLIMVE